MKKIALVTGTIAAILLLGAGCAPQSAEPTAPATNNGSSSQTSQSSEPTAAAGELADLSAITPPAEAIDDSAWNTMTTKSGVTLKTPTKGPYAPTTWTYSVLDKNDPHLKGDCYVTDATVYERVSENACQTATEFNAEAGERTGYYVFRDSRINLLTFNKKHQVNFDMNAYSAVIERIIKLIR